MPAISSSVAFFQGLGSTASWTARITNSTHLVADMTLARIADGSVKNRIASPIPPPGGTASNALHGTPSVAPPAQINIPLPHPSRQFQTKSRLHRFHGRSYLSYYSSLSILCNRLHRKPPRFGMYLRGETVDPPCRVSFNFRLPGWLGRSPRPRLAALACTRAKLLPPHGPENRWRRGQILIIRGIEPGFARWMGRRGPGGRCGWEDRLLLPPVPSEPAGTV